MADLVNFGDPEIKISAMGAGTWAWGDRSFWGYGKEYGIQDIEEAFIKTLECGITFFDTAEAYGWGLSEKIIGNLIHKYNSENIFIATKFMPYPWRISRKDFRKALRNSIKRLGLPKIDLYQIHWPIPPVAIETWVECMADAVEEGLCSYIGVSNYNLKQLKRATEVLNKRGMKLASNQVPYHLLNRKIEFDGVWEFCLANNIKIIAYSPLAQGLLTGKYTPKNPPRGLRNFLYPSSYLAKVTSLVEYLSEVGKAYGGKTPSQVALNWLISKGALPIPGFKNVKQAQDNAGALNWRLSEVDIKNLDEISLVVQK